MTPTELHELLRSLGAHPKKHLSQNFLIDGNILRKIVECADIQKGDHVLEIGPGPGALTQALLDAGAEVTAVEKDPLFAKGLERLPVTVYEEDILQFPLEKAKSQKVVANLPYSLTSPILARLAPRHDLFTTLTLMVQEEVARRITAKPSTADYSSLTLFLAFYSETIYAFPVKRTCFYPAPKVDSAIVHLTLREPPPVQNPELFLEMIRTAFKQRRKMLRGSLKGMFPNIPSECTARPEELSLEAFIDLYQSLIA